MQYYATKGNVRYTIEEDDIVQYKRRGFVVVPVVAPKVEPKVVEQPIEEHRIEEQPINVPKKRKVKATEEE